jgi:hypothetical protein
MIGSLDPATAGSEFIELGIVESLEFDHKPVEVGKLGQDICIKVGKHLDQA